MQIDEKKLAEIVQNAVESTIKKMIKKGLLGTVSASSDKSAFQRTEQLLFNYLGFKKIIRQKEQEIEDLRTYGVPQRGSAVVQYGGNCGGKPQGLVLDEERVEKAVENVVKSMETIVDAVTLIDKGMAAVKHDPYYKILEMRYFEGRTQEDMAIEFNCTQQNIAYHKNRLVRELSLRMFPDKVAIETLS